MSDSREILARHPFTASLSEGHRELLAVQAQPLALAAGEYLGHEGDAVQAFYLIDEGRVAIASYLGKRGTTPLQTVGFGEVVGWSWLVPPHRWQFDARAEEAVRGLALDAAWLREQCERDHELGYQLLQRRVAVIGSRLTAMRLQRADIYR
jgi:CRP/FNR family transcriptional regulator, cyclic AMP receptor protein